jgi:hypothetical protein
MSHQIHTYNELKRQIHEDLRTQHPEWIQPNGKCPKCDEHEARLKELLEALGQAECNTQTGLQLMVKNQTIQVRHESS